MNDSTKLKLFLLKTKYPISFRGKKISGPLLGADYIKYKEVRLHLRIPCAYLKKFSSERFLPITFLLFSRTLFSAIIELLYPIYYVIQQLPGWFNYIAELMKQCVRRIECN